MAEKRVKVVAVASGGGHWEQLMLVREAFHHCQVTYVTTMDGLGANPGIKPHVVPDCNRHRPLESMRCVAALTWLLIRVRPEVIVTTGALPGLIAVAIGRYLGARTLWLDSIANAEEISMAGKQARRFAHRWLSQWQIVAERSGAEFHGAVL